MTLELGKIVGQVELMGSVLLERVDRQHAILPRARDLLRRFAQDQEFLNEVASSEAGQHLRCASVGPEPLDGAWAPGPLPEQATVIAVDGSQIYPDRHGAAFYYAINIGSMVFRQGSGQAPEVASEPRLFYRDEHVYPDGELVTADFVGAERSLAEMERMADLALSEPAGGPPRLALADGPLLIWLQRSALSPANADRILHQYLGHLDRLRQECVRWLALSAGRAALRWSPCSTLPVWSRTRAPVDLLLPWRRPSSEACSTRPCLGSWLLRMDSVRPSLCVARLPTKILPGMDTACTFST